METKGTQSTNIKKYCPTSPSPNESEKLVRRITLGPSGPPLLKVSHSNASKSSSDKKILQRNEKNSYNGYKTFIQKSPSFCNEVLFRIDRVIKPLEVPYTGIYKVLTWSTKIL